MKNIIIAIFILLSVQPSFSQTLEWHAKGDYADIQYIGKDLFKVKTTSGKWVVVNKYGEMSIEANYDSITPLVEDRSLLLDVTGQYLKGILNEQGQLLKTFNNEERLANYQHFKEGMLAYGVISGSYYLFGYLDINGNTVIAPKYFWAAPFCDEKAVIQYQSTNYGLIHKTGYSALVDNRKFKFISTPVENKLLIAYRYSRGEKLEIVELDANGELSSIEAIESGTIVKGSFDYKSVTCLNGHVYHLDDAMRLIASSEGKQFNKPLAEPHVVAAVSPFRKVKEQSRWKILLSGKTLLQAPFRSLSFCDNKYVIASLVGQTTGILKLNNSGNVTVQDYPKQVTFFHKTEAKGNITINMDGLRLSTQMQIGILGLRENNQEEIITVPIGHTGILNHPISYFIPSSKIDTEVSKPITLNLYIDGMLYKTEALSLLGMHKTGFRVSNISAPEYSDAKGNAVIKFSVQSLEAAPSATAKIVVRGSTYQTRLFDGDETVYFSIPVTVPEEEKKTFSFIIQVEEEGCPSLTKTISRTISHYHLQ